MSVKVEYKSTYQEYSSVLGKDVYSRSQEVSHDSILGFAGFHGQ